MDGARALGPPPYPESRHTRPWPPPPPPPPPPRFFRGAGGGGGPHRPRRPALRHLGCLCRLNIEHGPPPNPAEPPPPPAPARPRLRAGRLRGQAARSGPAGIAGFSSDRRAQGAPGPPPSHQPPGRYNNKIKSATPAPPHPGLQTWKAPEGRAPICSDFMVTCSWSCRLRINACFADEACAPVSPGHVEAARDQPDNPKK
jgi:hypothetical protein